MKGSFRIATIAGSEVRIHFSFLLLLAFWAGAAYFQAGVAVAFDTLVYLLLVFLCVLLHEFGHALAGRYFGIRTPEIVLLPIGGVARLERIPTSPFQELVITAAGPAVNVAIAAGCLLFLGAGGAFNSLLATDITGGNLLREVLTLNLMLIAFNIIPAFPMDGGRILRALLATQMKYATATRIAARVGQGIGLIFIIVGFIPWPGGQLFMLLFIGLFVIIGAQQELVYAQIREVVASHTISEVMTTRFETLGDTMRMADVPDFLMGSNQEVYPIVGEDLEFKGLADRADLAKAARELPSEALVIEAARTVPAVTLATSSTEVLEHMQRLSESVLPVVNPSGQIIGLVEFSRMVQNSAN